MSTTEALDVLVAIEDATGTRYPGNNGRWWYEDWGSTRLCQQRHNLGKRANPCRTCRDDMTTACFLREPKRRRAVAVTQKGKTQ